MDRRQFNRKVTGAAMGAVLLPFMKAAPAKKRPEVPFKLSVMLWTVYRDLPFEQRLEKVAQAGYRAVELVGEFKDWSDADFKLANSRKRSLKMVFDAAAGLKHGIAGSSTSEAFLAELTDFFPVAHKLECPSIIVLSGNRVEGLTGNAQRDACIETLKRAGEMAAKNDVTLLLENIDPEENPKYFLTSVAEGLEIVQRVDNPHVKFLYDFYHEQIAEGNLIAKLEKNISLVGAVHVADVPGRHEPGTGEINYANIFRKLAQLDFGGYIAMEFLPNGDPVAKLRAAQELALSSARRHE